MIDRGVGLWPLSQAALPLLLFGQLEVSVRQDTCQSAEDPQCLVERQRVVEEQVSSNQSDAEFKMTKHVVGDSRGGSNDPVDGEVNQERHHSREQHRHLGNKRRTQLPRQHDKSSGPSQ